MDQGSTKNGLILSTRRFQENADVRITSAFRGATRAGFSEGINKHWRMLGAKFFTPVRMHFRKPANHFGLLRLPGRRRSKVVHYTFSPRIQLNLSVSPTTNMCFEASTRHLLQSRNTLPASPVMREFWTTISEFDELKRVMSFTNERTLDQRSESSRSEIVKRSLMVLRKGNVTESLAGAMAQPARFYVSIPLVVQNSKHSIDQSLIRSGSWSGENQKPGSPGHHLAQTLNLLPSVLNRRLSWTRLSLQNFPENSSSTKLFSLLTVVKDGATAVMSPSLLKHLTIPETHPGTAAAGNSFTSLSLTLARKVSGVEDLTPGARPFPLSPNLSYARQDTTQLQAVVNALRDLRSSQSETKAQPAPQLPSIEQLTSQVRQQLERELRIEKERRGL